MNSIQLYYSPKGNNIVAIYPAEKRKKTNQKIIVTV